MPYLVDGNNLMHALASAGCVVERQGLCQLLSRLLPEDGEIHVAFDGAQPPAASEREMLRTGIAVNFSGRRPADDLICAQISEHSAPRRLTVVSTDRRIRQAARRRRCRSIDSETFARHLLRRPQTPPQPDAEADARQRELNEEEARRWMREFGFDEDDPPAGLD